MLAVYTGTDVTALTSVASDEDHGGFLTSAVTFNAVRGTEYAIAIDGLGGANGSIMLSWELVESASVDVPRILAAPQSQTVVEGDNATFVVVAQSKQGVGVGLSYQWFYKSTLLPWATEATLTLTNVQRSQVGSYRVEVSTATAKLRTVPAAQLEVSPQPEAQTEDKFKDLLTTPEGAAMQGYGGQHGEGGVGGLYGNGSADVVIDSE